MAALAQGPNDDVDRAMETFAASGIQYRTFAATVTVPAQAEHQSNDATSTMSFGGAPTRIDAFPLLTAALPEVSQFLKPNPVVAPATPPTPYPTENEPPPKLEGASPPVLKQTDTLWEVRSLPVSKTPVPRKLQPYIDASNASADRSTPLAAVFHTLQAASPFRRDRTAPDSQLQNILKRL